MAVDYSLKNEWYREINKSCFTVALNVAYDNCKAKGHENLLREAQRSKGGITNEQIKNVQTEIKTRLEDIRSHFSHFYHDEKSLIFEKDNIVKDFLESAYEKAQSSVIGSTRQSDYKGVVPPLFEPHDGMITAAGVVFLASFFCHRSNVYRMLGAVKGFKHTGKEELSDGAKRDYGFTRRLMAHYSLRDSYVIKAEETKSFRDLLGYLSRVPQQAVDWLNEHNQLSEDEKKEFLNQKPSDEESQEQSKTENTDRQADRMPRRSLRKTDKFILFAAKFIEDWAQKEKMDVTFARYQKTVTEDENKNQDGKQVRDVQLKYEKDTKKLNPDFDYKWTYYIRNNHAIIQIKPDEYKQAVSARISENELKYLVLLIFQGKGWEAIKKIGDYIFHIGNKIKIGRFDHNEERRMPSFLKNPPADIIGEMVENRLKYIRDELNKVIETIKKEEPQNNKWLLYKGKKISIILKFISDSISDIKKRPDVNEYNTLRDMLQKLDFDNFYERLKSYVSEGRIEQTLYDEIKGIKDISTLCIKICELRLAALEELEKEGGDDLNKYIGLAVQEKHKNYDDSNTPQKKAERFLESQFSVGKNFLRETFYDEYIKNRKSLYEIIKEKITGITPLNENRWYLMDKNPKEFESKDSKIIRGLCNIYIQDILCMKIALWYYENLSPSYKNKLKWDFIGQGFGYDRYKLSYKTDCGITIEFKLADLNRLDIIEKPKMIENICHSFILEKDVKKQTISWHEFRQDGIAKYRKLQKEVVEAVFEFENSLKIPDKNWLTQGYVPFNKNKRFEDKGFSTFILEEAVRKGKIKSDDKEPLRKVRTDFFHEQFDSTDAERRIFDKYMPAKHDGKNKGGKMQEKQEKSYTRRI